MARGKTRDKAVTLPRQIEALELRKVGFSYRAIGEQLGISHEQAHRDVSNELERLAKLRTDKAEELRELELERLDVILANLMQYFLVSPQPQMAMAMLKVTEQRAKLLGLYAPSEIKIDDWRSQAIADIKSGRVSFDALAEAFDHDLATELFRAAGVPLSAE